VELKEGFKLTELGVIPQDWEVVKMAEIGEPIIGLTYRPSDVAEYGTLVLRSSNIQRNRLAFHDNVYVNMDIPTRVITKENDLLICVRNGSKQLIGKCALIDKKTEGSAFGAFMSVFRSDMNKLMVHLFQSSVIQKQIDEVMGATINQLTNRNLRDFLVPVSKIKIEQEAIANALSDMDAYIESLEKLIAKKRLIKKGVMQELLTGKRRLEGFNSKWVVKKLSDLADIRSGGTPSTTQPQFWNGTIPWCTPTDITHLNGRKLLCSTTRKITDIGLKSSSADYIPANSIVMTSRATIGECAINVVPVTTNQGFKNFIPSDLTDLNFLYYLLITQKQGFISLCAGSTFLEISKTQLAHYEVKVPLELNEQIAIGQSLSDLDSDIFVIEDKLQKARLLKQGMMQELLTGRIRLV
jgi:type I restriction enzyme, S subunit